MFKALLMLALPTQLFAFEFFLLPDGRACKWDSATIILWKVVPEAPAIARESMLYATQAWNDASAGRLTFAEGDGGVQVVWGMTNPNPACLAQSSLHLSGSAIVGATITVNTRHFSWVRGPVPDSAPSGTSDLDPVLLHEMGHVLGLNHSDRTDGVFVEQQDLPTMNSIIHTSARSLHRDDVTGLRALYEIDVPLPELVVEASPARGTAPLTVALFQTGGNEETRWDFGDGTGSRAASETHRFRTPGIYTVTATVNGMTKSTTIEVLKRKKKSRALKKQERLLR